jgi:hypothetical protein
MVIREGDDPKARTKVLVKEQRLAPNSRRRKPEQARTRITEASDLCLAQLPPPGKRLVHPWAQRCDMGELVRISDDEGPLGSVEQRQSRWDVALGGLVK